MYIKYLILEPITKANLIDRVQTINLPYLLESWSLCYYEI